MGRPRSDPSEMPLPHPDSGTTTTPQCPRCGGLLLYYDNEVKVGRTGALKLCPCAEAVCRCGGRTPYRYWNEDAESAWCPCRRGRRRLAETSRLFKQASIPERFRWKFQDDFTSRTPDGNVVPFAEVAQSYVSTLVDSGEEPRRGFLLRGPPGTGKTLLGCIMLNELILHRCRPGRFVNLSRSYFNKLRDTYSESSEEYGQTWKIFDELVNLPYLLLDDFGVQRDTPWEQEMLYDLVDARYGAEKFTIVTTNQALGDFQQLFGGRIYSRLVEMCHMVEMDGMDYRLHMQSSRR